MSNHYFKNKKFDKIIPDTLASQKKSTYSDSYLTTYERDALEIRRLLKLGKKVTFSKNDNYVVIDGTTFNGFGKWQIDNIQELVNIIIQKRNRTDQKAETVDEKPQTEKQHCHTMTKTEVINKIIDLDNTWSYPKLYIKTMKELHKILDEMTSHKV